MLCEGIATYSTAIGHKQLIFGVPGVAFAFWSLQRNSSRIPQNSL